DSRDAVDGALHRRKIGEGAPDDLEAGVAPGEGEVGAAARGEIVEDAHAMPLGEEALHDVGADEPGSARDEEGRRFRHVRRPIMVVAARACQLRRHVSRALDNLRAPSLVCWTCGALPVYRRAG